MNDFQSVLGAAQQLPTQERLRLIDALWASVPSDADLPLHEDWAPELERRVAAIENGAVSSVSWPQVREEALARIGHGKIR